MTPATKAQAIQFIREMVDESASLLMKTDPNRAHAPTLKINKYAEEKSLDLTHVMVDFDLTPGVSVVISLWKREP